MLSKKLELILIILLRRVDLSSQQLRHERRKWQKVSTSFSKLQTGLSDYENCVWICAREGNLAQVVVKWVALLL